MTTTCTMVFIYNGKEYPYEYDFDVNYPEYAAHYMFEDGNYSCDCNRSAWIIAKYGNVMPYLECGHTIEMKDLKVHNPTPEEIGDTDEVTQAKISYLLSQQKIKNDQQP